MADECDRQSPPRLVGYESWLYQMPCFDSSGDVFVSVALSGQAEIHSEPSTRWLIAVGDVSGRGEIASRMKDTLETEVIRLARTTSDPASILMAINKNLLDPDRFACLLVAVIDSDCHELTLASAGYLAPFLRRVDRRVDSIAEKAIGMPLWIVPEQTYENVTVPIGPGEVVIFYSDDVTSVIDSHEQMLDTGCLRQAIARAPDGAASVGQSILQTIRRFGKGGKLMDDITLLCVGRPVLEVRALR
jgi:phosphoserine phosphatase RsbU/P